MTDDVDKIVMSLPVAIMEQSNGLTIRHFSWRFAKLRAFCEWPETLEQLRSSLPWSLAFSLSRSLWETSKSRLWACDDFEEYVSHDVDDCVFSATTFRIYVLIVTYLGLARWLLAICHLTFFGHFHVPALHVHQVQDSPKCCSSPIQRDHFGEFALLKVCKMWTSK